MSALPTGTVTFLFTDIEGSTKLAQAYPDRWETLRERHHAMLHTAIEAQQGFVFEIIGDAFCAAFHTIGDALHAAIAAQRALQTEDWGSTPIKVRMGLHTGAAERRDTDYRGYLTMARVQRVMSTAYGGQVLLSNASAELARGELPADVTLRDMGEHQLKGLLNPEHLWQLVAPDLRPDFPSLPTLNAIPNNLPVQLTSFIGRESDIAEVKRLLSASRLVTLTGSGGAGKTRLSLQVAAEEIDDFAQGVWFVELAPLTDPALIPQTVALVLGLREEQGRPLMTVLTDYLRAKTALIILDNCEHLIEGCAQLADTLLRAAPNVKVLASSREALNIAGEATYRVPSLASPDPQHLPSIEALTQYEAVRLFIERAVAVMPSFEVNNANAPAVAQICHHLDGIPLALELAAARGRGLKVEQIAQRLDDRFRLLTGGSRMALPRHQTLRATIDWSHSLLTEQERVLFRRLAVFAGGWSIEAAEAVCAGDGLDSSEILDLLLRLVDKSLISMAEHSTETRYHMLETIREYARDRLQESGEAIPLQQQHLAYFLQFAETDEPESNTDERKQWRNRLEFELDNLRAALDWSFKNDTGTGLRLAGLFGKYSWAGLHRKEGLDRLRMILALPTAPSRTQDRAKALYWAGSSQRVEAWNDPAEFRSRLHQSPIHLEESLAIYRELQFQPGIADALYELARVMEDLADWEAARKLFADSIRISQAVSDKIRTAKALIGLGNISSNQGDLTEGRRLYEEALRIYREAGLRFQTLWPLGNLGIMALNEGNLTSARSYCEESLALYREENLENLATWVLVNLGEIAARQGRYDEARSYIERSMAFNREAGSNIELGPAFLQLAFVAYRQGDYSMAEEFHKKGLALLKDSQVFIPYALEGLASVTTMQGKTERAITLFGAAAALREAINTPAPPLYKADNERDMAVARTQLSEETFNAAWEAGQDMTLEQAVAYALEVTDA